MTLRREDLQVQTGRCVGGTFVRVVHRPSGVARYRGPIGKEWPGAVTRRLIGEIERELESRIPDARDGLTKVERAILYVLDETRRELGREQVPTAMLYGRVVELVDVGREEFMATLERLVGRRG